MKKYSLCFSAAFCVQCFFPLLVLIGALTGRPVEPRPVVLALLVTFGGALPLLLLLGKDDSGLCTLLRSLRTVLPFLGTVFWVIHLIHGDKWSAPAQLACIIVSALLLVVSTRSGWLCILYGIFYSLIVLALLYLTPLIFLFSFGSSEVISSVPAPDGSRTATVYSISEGALGGSTRVDVIENRITIDLGAARLLPPTQTVYTGDWGESFDMALAWQDDSTLLINSDPYPLGR